MAACFFKAKETQPKFGRAEGLVFAQELLDTRDRAVNEIKRLPF